MSLDLGLELNSLGLSTSSLGVDTELHSPDPGTSSLGHGADRCKFHLDTSCLGVKLHSPDLGIKSWS